MRSDKDTWDITTSVGSTALFVAAARALEAQKPDPLVVDEYAEVFCRAVGGPWADLLDGKAPDHPLATAEFGIPFIAFQAGRTRYFDAYFRDVAAAGVTQVVLLAAGLDSRAYRIDWAPGTTVFELDQPRVLDFKRETLATSGAAPKAERREVAVDLRDDWPQALRDSGFDPGKPSAWIAEGLLIYLPASAQEQLFLGIDSLAGARSHVAVEEGRPMDTAEFEVKLKDAKTVDDSRGQWYQMIYNEQCAPAVQWFSEHGWSAEETLLTDYLAAVGRTVENRDADAEYMLSSVSLVRAVKN